MPMWIIMLGVAPFLAAWLYRKYGDTPPASLQIDPFTGQVTPYTSPSLEPLTPNFWTGLYNAVFNLAPSQGAMDFIRRTETFVGTPYHGAADAAGVYTIGYGHKIVPGDPYWPYGSVRAITEQQGEDQFQRDLEVAASAVRRNVNITLTQGQFDALVSFFYNIGEYKVMHSGPGNGPATLIVLLNAGDYDGAANEFQKWVYSNGQIQGGLVARRLAEASTFKGVG